MHRTRRSGFIAVPVSPCQGTCEPHHSQPAVAHSFSSFPLPLLPCRHPLSHIHAHALASLGHHAATPPPAFVFILSRSYRSVARLRHGCGGCIPRIGFQPQRRAYELREVPPGEGVTSSVLPIASRPGAKILPRSTPTPPPTPPTPATPNATPSPAAMLRIPPADVTSMNTLLPRPCLPPPCPSPSSPLRSPARDPARDKLPPLVEPHRRVPRPLIRRRCSRLLRRCCRRRCRCRCCRLCTRCR